MPLIEGYGWPVIDGYFQEHGATFLLNQPLLGSFKQSGASSRSLESGVNINGQNVAGAAGIRLGHNKPGNPGRAVLLHFRHQRERPAASHVPGQLTP